MEEQLAELAAKVAELEGKANVTNTMFAETYYYLINPVDDHHSRGVSCI